MYLTDPTKGDRSEWNGPPSHAGYHHRSVGPRRRPGPGIKKEPVLARLLWVTHPLPVSGTLLLLCEAPRCGSEGYGPTPSGETDLHLLCSRQISRDKLLRDLAHHRHHAHSPAALLQRGLLLRPLLAQRDEGILAQRP